LSGSRQAALGNLLILIIRGALVVCGRRRGGGKERKEVMGSSNMARFCVLVWKGGDGFIKEKIRRRRLENTTVVYTPTDIPITIMIVLHTATTSHQASALDSSFI
jgi:hypothetical protein